MSLLDKGRETVTVYQEETWTDRDGNTMTRPGPTGVTTRATIQPAAQSGTSARRAEQDNEGFETEQVYRMHLPRSFTTTLGAQARIEWKGQYWAVVGDAFQFNGSARTKRVEYTIRRT